MSNSKHQKYFKTLLIAEDEGALLRILSHAFEKAGFKVIEAVNGQKAVALSLEKKPDAIILDIYMPIESGLQALADIRKSGSWGSEVPVFLLTNYSDQQKIAEAEKNYIVSYWVKTNWSLEDLVKQVKDFFGLA